MNGKRSAASSRYRQVIIRSRRMSGRSGIGKGHARKQGVHISDIKARSKRSALEQPSARSRMNHNAHISFHQLSGMTGFKVIGTGLSFRTCEYHSESVRGYQPGKRSVRPCQVNGRYYGWNCKVCKCFGIGIMKRMNGLLRSIDKIQPD